MNYYEQIRDFLVSAFNNFSLKKLNVNDKGSVVGNLLNAYTYSAIEILGAVEVGLDRLDIDNASNEDLEAIADNYNLVRNEGTPSTGYINLWTYSPGQDLIIPAGTSFFTDQGQTFVTTQDAVLFSDPSDYPTGGEFTAVPGAPAKNAYSRYYAMPIIDGVTYDFDTKASEQLEPTLEIPVESSEIGKDSNVDAQSVSNSSYNQLGGLNPITMETEEGVENSLAFSGGSDPETDDEFRTRIKRHIAGTGTSTIKYLENASLLPGIDDARIIEPDNQNSRLSPQPGSVYLVAASARAMYNPQWAYEEATDGEIKYPVSYATTPKEQIRNLLEDYRSVGVGIVVREAEVVRINFQNEQDDNGDMIVFVKPGTNLVTYTQIVENVLNDLLQSYRIGQNIYKSDVIEAVRAVDAVVDVGPFNIVGERWESDDNGAGLVEYGSGTLFVGDGTIRRVGLQIYAEEIVRPARSLNFRLVFDNVFDN